MMDPGEGSARPNIHPLTNELVLQVLAKQIHVRDIPKSRLVCHKWNKHLIPRMRAEILVQGLDQKGFGRSSTRLAKFLACMAASQEIPFGNYLLHNLNLNDPLVERFYSICGHYIHTLRVQFMPHEIDICSLRELLLMRAPAMVNFSVEGVGIPETVTNHPNLFPNWSGYHSNSQGGPILPSLESLEFKTEEGQRCHPGFLHDLFKAAPNLKNLTFLKYSDYYYSIHILDALRESGNYLQLKTLHLERLCDDAFGILIDMSQTGMALREFSFQSLTEDVQSSSLEELIDSQRDTLEILSLNEVMGTKNLLIRLPPMKKLRKLTRSAICSSQIAFGPICYATNLPNLEELSVFAFADELDWSDYFSDTVNWLPCASLKKLELPINLRDPNKLRRLGKIFPSVTKLIVSSPSDEIIPLLWQLWPELTELHLSLTDGNYNIDSLFTGIPSLECSTILANKSYGEVDIERIRTGPSIAYLRGLRKLVLEISPRDIFSSFCFQSTSCLPTDITGYFGLSYLCNLEELVVTSSQISMECAVYLLSKFHRFTNIRICDVDNRPVVSSIQIFN